MSRTVAALVASWLAACGAEKLKLVSLESADPRAVCNDGSPSGYYWKAGRTDTRTWIVDLEGGGWCTDEKECKKRCASGKKPEDGAMCTSRGWPAEMSYEGGLMAPRNDSTLYGANKAFVKYCTSDAHMGNADAFGMKFRGVVVVQAVLNEMVRRGLGQGTQRHRLVFGGQSAGGRGAMVNLDYVVEMLGPVAGANTDVFGLLDSPLYIDIPPYPGSDFKGFAAESRDVYSVFNIQHLGTACAAAHATEPWKCTLGQYRMPHVKTPYMLVAAEYDQYQLGRNEITANPDSSKRMYAEAFAAKTASLVKSLVRSWPDNSTWANAVYSRACYEHATSLGSVGYDESFTMKDNMTLDSAMAAFLKDTPSGAAGSAALLEWVDDCEGFACGDGNCKSEKRRKSKKRPSDIELVVV